MIPHGYSIVLFFFMSLWFSFGYFDDQGMGSLNDSVNFNVVTIWMEIIWSSAL